MITSSTFHSALSIDLFSHEVVYQHDTAQSVDLMTALCDKKKKKIEETDSMPEALQEVH